MDDIGADHIQRLFGIGQRQKIMRVEPGDTCPAKMIGNPQRAHPVSQCLQPPQIGVVETIRRANRHRDTVHRNRIPLTRTVNHRQRTPARDHEIFRNHFNKINRHIVFEERREMWGPHAKAKAAKRGDRLGGHDGSRRSDLTGAQAGQVDRHYFSVSVPPAAAHFLAVLALKPWPLQLFWPLHS